ncbi:hypothetical protein KAI78_02085 [bacterium]|nr:hypothetical protein [bacterium]
MNTFQILITIVTSLGLGGITSVIIRNQLEKKTILAQRLNEIKSEHYKNLLIFMACSLDIKKKEYFSIHQASDQTNSEYYFNTVKEYYYHELLYSSDDVIISLKNFIESPSESTFISTTKAMRKDLWGNRTKLTEEEIRIVEGNI